MVKNGSLLFVVFTISLLFPITVLSDQHRPESEPYQWKNVQMVGGNFVDGIIFHPTAKGVRYARTDMGGAYRWDDAKQQWQPILDWISWEDNNRLGV